MSNPPTPDRAALVAELRSHLYYAASEPEVGLPSAEWCESASKACNEAAALIAADGERLAELEAMEKRAKDADAIDDAYERGRTCDKRACGDALSAVQDYILSGKEDPR